jgi:prepilin-type N-terminal cleavage/methylation domain-containing protein
MFSLHLSPTTRRPQGITLLELLVALTVIAVLVSLYFPIASLFKAKAQDVACKGNLRGLHAGFSAYLGDHAFVWPQSPEMRDDQSSEDIEENEVCKWWYEQLKPYGIARRSWLCPADRQGMDEIADEQHYDLSYIPTNFDAIPNRAYEWARQPWLIERGGFHKDGGANKVMPDGSIQTDAFPSDGL